MRRPRSRSEEAVDPFVRFGVAATSIYPVERSEQKNLMVRGASAQSASKFFLTTMNVPACRRADARKTCACARSLPSTTWSVLDRGKPFASYCTAVPTPSTSTSHRARLFPSRRTSTPSELSSNLPLRCRQTLPPPCPRVARHALNARAENLSKIKWLRHVVSLDLSRNSLDDASQQQLRMLFNLRQSRYLDLRHNDLGPAAGASLVESLPRCKTLEVCFTSFAFDIGECCRCAAPDTCRNKRIIR